MNMNKPPLGLTPREVFDTQADQYRSSEILKAMERYSEVEKPIPVEWVRELRERMFES